MENISKIVLSKSTGKRIGYILDVAIDFKTMNKIGYYIVDEESEGEFFIDISNILSISSDFVVIENSSELQYVSEREESLLGKEVIDCNSLSLGYIKKLCFSKKRLVKIITDKCEIYAKYISKVGKDIVFVDFKRKRKSKKESYFPKAQFDLPVQTQITQLVTIPEKIRLSPTYYIGKICGENIFGYNNEKIILKDEVITKSIVDKAKRHNKLNQLFFAIKR